MVTFLDCIRRTASVIDSILDHREEYMAPLMADLKDDLDSINEIVFVGSGTSSTSAITSKNFVEKVTKIRTTVYYPNEFLCNTYVYNPNALYVFTSQTGSSLVAREAMRMVRDKGYHHVSITESEETPIATESKVHLNMGCGYEEYPMRTIGYCASVLTHMLMGMKIGLAKGVLSQEEFDDYIAQARKVAVNHPIICDKACEWMDVAKHSMLRSDVIIFTGADVLYGVSLEGAMKIWETPQIPAIGYEIEEGMHGPNYGYTSRCTVIVLNDCGREKKKLMSLGRYMKDVWHNGFVVGPEVVDDKDLQIDIVGGDFLALEFAPVVQIVANHLALAYGRDMSLPHDNSVMYSYFTTHEGDK